MSLTVQIAGAGQILQAIQGAGPTDADGSADFRQLLSGVLQEPGALDHFRRAFKQVPALERALLDRLNHADNESAVPLLRLLSLAEAEGRTLTAVFRFTTSPDRRLRSLASALVAKQCRNPRWLEQALQDPDARVRANAIEAARQPALSLETIQTALNDTNHRVVCNAIVRLFEFDAPRAQALLEETARRESPSFRAAAAWAIGAAGCRALRGLAEQLRLDQVASVRSNALKAMVRLRQLAATSP